MRISSVSSNFYYSLFNMFSSYYPTYYDAYDNDDKDYILIWEELNEKIIDEYYEAYKQKYKWIKPNNQDMKNNLTVYMLQALIEYRELMWDNEENNLNTPINVFIKRFEKIHNKINA